MNNAIETITDDLPEGWSIEIHYDTDAGSPREWDNMGKMCVWQHRHHRIALAEDREVADMRDDMDLNALEDHLLKRGYLVETFHLRDIHGIVLVDRAGILEGFGGKKLSPKKKALAQGVLKAEVDTYRAWAEGECYGWLVRNPDGENVDSCWGYIGEPNFDYMTTEALASAKWHAEKAAEWTAVKTECFWINA